MTDTLLEALVFLGKFHRRPINRVAATAGLPLDEGVLTPATFLRAAERHGLSAKVLREPLGKLRPGILPAVAILQDNEAVVITAIDEKQVETIDPVSGGTRTTPLPEFSELYQDYSILVRPGFDFEERSKHRQSQRSRSWFWGTLWRFRSFYGRVALTSIVINTFALTSSIFIMNVYDRVVPNAAFETLFFLAIGAGIVFLFDFLLKMLRAFFVDRAGQRADILLNSAIYEHILAIKFSARPASAGAFASQARGYESLREFFTSATLVALVDLPFVVFFAFIVWLLGGPVAIPLLVGLVLALLVGGIMQSPLSKSVKRGYAAANQRHALLVESLNGLETVKTLCAESEFQKKMDNCVRESSDADVGSRWASALSVNLTALIQQLVSIAIVIVGVYQIAGGNMSMGALIACVILGGRGMAPLAQVAGLFTRLQQSRTSLEGLDEIMKTPTERSAEASPKIDRTDFDPSISLDQLTFTYPGEPIPAVLVEKLKIKPGERIAFLGKVGSGKSTLLNLLAGLQEPAEGSIRISGREIRQFEPVDLRSRIGYVSQQINLFYGSVLDNLRLGVPWATDDQIMQASELTTVTNFTANHPGGLDRQVGEHGHLLSGGQRQAVALARALVPQPPLLLLDEPTSAMDMNTEAAVVEGLGKYLEEENATLLISTHVPALLALVDRIIVLNEGKIAADGPRDQILKQLQQNKPRVLAPQNAKSSS